jgi:putative ABC transport system permease protein
MADTSPALRAIEGAGKIKARALGRFEPHRGSRPSLVPLPRTMTGRLAWRNLAHDRVRFIVTLVGIVFSVVLMAVQCGMLVGFAETAAALVTHAGADFWVVSRGTSNVDQSLNIPEQHRFKALSIPGVAAVDKLIVHFAAWRRPDGRAEPVIIVGFDLDSGIGGPWNVVAGSIEDLHLPDSIMIDRVYAAKLGVVALGQTVEIEGRRARVVGFTDGIRAFTQSPYIFTSYKNSRKYSGSEFSGLVEGRTHYLLVRAATSADLGEMRRRLQNVLPTADVHPTAEFASMTTRYWLLTTGAGAALMLGAVLGLAVGVIIVAQTLYAATVERLGEFATLRAIGAANAYLNSIVLKQALTSGAIGYLLGIAIAAALVRAAADSIVSLVLPWQLAVAVGLVTLALCSAASLVAIHRIKTIDPTIVFR